MSAESSLRDIFETSRTFAVSLPRSYDPSDEKQLMGTSVYLVTLGRWEVLFGQRIQELVSACMPL